MKKHFSITAIVLVLVLGMAVPAWAVDIKVMGQWSWGIGWYANSNFYNRKHDNQTQDLFQARQRIRNQIDFISSENLKGTLMFEIGGITWGRDNAATGKSGRGAGGSLDADGVNVETKRAFIDWMVPGTDLSVRMGIQALYLPTATNWGNPVFMSDVAAVTANYAFTDKAGLTLFWARPFDANWVDSNNQRLSDEMDILGFMLPLSLDGMKITPWGMYSFIGNASGFWAYRATNQSDAGYTMTPANTFNGKTHAWHLGAAYNLTMFDPFVFSMDLMYGRLSGNTSADVGATAFADLDGNPKSSGWLVDAMLEYKTDWGVPGLYGWYATGDDADDVKHGEFGRLPVLGTDIGFSPTAFGTAGGRGWAWDKALSRAGVGMWGAGVRIKDLTFIDKDITHLVSLTYMRGTNDKDIVRNNNLHNPTAGAGRNNPAIFGENIYMTTDDAAYEVDLVTFWKLYENLVFTLNMGWVHLDLGNVWAKDGAGLFGNKTSDAWTVEFIFEYKW